MRWPANALDGSRSAGIAAGTVHAPIPSTARRGLVRVRPRWRAPRPRRCCTRSPVPLVGGASTLGRGDDNDVVRRRRAGLAPPRPHRAADGGFVLVDLGSRHGTCVNGERLSGTSRACSNRRRGHARRPADALPRGRARRSSPRDETYRSPSIADGRLRRRAPDDRPRRAQRRSSSPTPTSRASTPRSCAVTGRSSSSTSARATARGSTASSSSGRALEPGAEVGIGPYRLVFDGVVPGRPRRRTARCGSTRSTSPSTVKDKTILEPDVALDRSRASWSPSSARAAPARARCSRRWRACTGRRAAGSLLNGEPLATRLTDVGYVPQDDIVHPPADRPRGAALRGAAAPAAGRVRRRDRRGRRRACSTSCRCDEHADTLHRLAVGRAAQAHRRGGRAAQPARASSSSTSRRPGWTRGSRRR